MGLSTSLSNALSGLNSTQNSLEVLSRNVANAGTPGYHRQEVTLVERTNDDSTFVRFEGVRRAFNTSVQQAYNQNVSDLGYANLQSEYMQRIDGMLGAPGSETSLDSIYQNFENSLQALSTSPEDYASRAEVVATAQAVVETLNRLTNDVQGMRQQTETEIASHVSDLNRMLKSLQNINSRITDRAGDAGSRLTLLDERDRLVADISELVDVRATYGPNETVALSTRSGMGLINAAGATVFEFQSAGRIHAHSTFSTNDAENNVGTLMAYSPGGMSADVIKQNIFQSGRIRALVEMRDSTLVVMQAQLDDVATGMALALSTVETDGTAVAGPPADGFSIDLADVQQGNSFSFSYTAGGIEQNVRVVRVDDPANLPMDFTGPDGARVIGLNFSGGIGAIATALDTALGPAINVSNPSGTTLQIVDDGVGNTTDITSLTSRTTVTANQGAGLALSLFTDSGNLAFTNSLEGDGQKIGFAGRIKVNAAIVVDNSLLVQFEAGGSLGNADRANYLLTQLEDVVFTSSDITSAETGSFRLSGSARHLIEQMLNFQGTGVSSAEALTKSGELAMEAINQRMDSEYNVNVDEEMARLMALQNAYAASARIISVVQELLDELLRM